MAGLNVPEEEDRLTCLVGAMEKTRSLFGLPSFPPSEETNKLMLVVLAKAISATEAVSQTCLRFVL